MVSFPLVKLFQDENSEKCCVFQLKEGWLPLFGESIKITLAKGAGFDEAIAILNPQRGLSSSWCMHKIYEAGWQ